MAVPGANEIGTSTGLSISFDTWSGNTLPDGAADIEGIIVMLDGKTLLRHSLPTRNGECDDTTSLQTGPYTPENNGDWVNLCWQPFRLEVTEDAKITVEYKGVKLLDAVQTDFYASPGQIVFAGRTGGANENHHVDNVVLQTTIAADPIVSTPSGDHNGFSLQLFDIPGKAVDPTSVAVKLDNEPVTVTTTKDGDTTTIVYSTAWPDLLASATTYAVTVDFEDSSKTSYSATKSFTTPFYATLPWANGSRPGTGVAEEPGFNARIWQLEQAVDAVAPADVMVPNIEWGEAVIAGLAGPNVADLFGAVDENLFPVDTVINFNQDHATGPIGNFTPDDPIPGIPGLGLTLDDNIAGEFVTYVEFPDPGFYQMGVNSDDGFRVTVGEVPGWQALEVLEPGGIAGGIACMPATPSTGGIGPALPTPAIEAEVVLVDPALACDAIANAEELAGKIALIDRGTCTFTDKINRAAEAGAVAVIMVNERSDFPLVMGGNPVTIPCVIIYPQDGAKLKENIGSLVVRLGTDPTLRLGEFNGARGASDTIFNFVVPTAGLWPLRCLWLEAGGGANVEWFSVSPEGEKVLLNDAANP
ncbi:MAG: hypothetical protein KDM81_06765, partial [Verrucomicrobiae bacterium]|nr:hypothetical protein [Verrucomicrobiae bacterium]